MGDNGGLSVAGLDRMRAALARGVESGEVAGLVGLVHRRGRTHIVPLGTLELGGGVPMERDTIFRIASLTKQVVAVAAMILVEECRLRLDDPVDDLLPELADRQVLRRLDSPLGDTVPAERSITLRDLLTFRMGLGAIMAAPGAYPIQRAMDEAGIGGGPDGPSFGPDEWIKRIGTLPLAYQPGSAWMYHTSADVLGVLIARAGGRTLPEFLAERVFEPLGMTDTGFHVPTRSLGRVAVSYSIDPETGMLDRRAEPEDRAHDRPPAFPSGGGGPGLYTTVDDYLAMCRMLLAKGRYDGGRLLSRPSVEVMTTDHLTPGQKAGNEIFLGSGGWGFGVAVDGARDQLYTRPGRFGWTGGLGTTAYTDPAEDMVAILFTQTAMTSPRPPDVFQDFFTTAYAAIDD
jgi:CubicO group peptidase (beta-lactamase class C family)